MNPSNLDLRKPWPNNWPKIRVMEHFIYFDFSFVYKPTDKSCLVCDSMILAHKIEEDDK